MENLYGIETLWSQSDMVIKTVAIILLIMSLASWYVMISRALALYQLRYYKRGLNQFWHAGTFDQGLELLGEPTKSSPFRKLAQEGLDAKAHHISHKSDLHSALPLSDWLTSSLRGSIDETAEQLQRGLAILASVGSTAPFVGLFGTVWGIYHALISIGISGQASIDKVAGPVGEALIMTAFGLAVAIPAVLGYNALTRGNKDILSKLNRFAYQLHAYLILGAAPKVELLVAKRKGTS